MTEDEARLQIEARVSRETVRRLQLYADLLARWQKTINLVAPSTLHSLWSRHMLDSAQLMDHVPPSAQSWMDMGSGGGFPGLVCAAIAVDSHPQITVTLIEADLRKAAFLRETARHMGIAVAVLSQRVEDLPQSRFDVISARALAPLVNLCAYAHPHLSSSGFSLFQKGARYRDELATARQDWQMCCSVHPSVTDPEAVLLKIGQLHHV